MTYDANGMPTTPTITAGLNAPTGISVDTAGKIYVTNYLGRTVTTYKADGTPTTPTIATQNSGEAISPKHITVDATGKICVISLAPGIGIYSNGTWISRRIGRMGHERLRPSRSLNPAHWPNHPVWRFMRPAKFMFQRVLAVIAR